jgi:hypothetical protein
MPININTAPEEALSQLKGIGPARAATIIELRKKKGVLTPADLVEADIPGTVVDPWLQYDLVSFETPEMSTTSVGDQETKNTFEHAATNQSEKRLADLENQMAALSAQLNSVLHDMQHRMNNIEMTKLKADSGDIKTSVAAAASNPWSAVIQQPMQEASPLFNPFTDSKTGQESFTFFGNQERDSGLLGSSAGIHSMAEKVSVLAPGGLYPHRNSSLSNVGAPVRPKEEGRPSVVPDQRDGRVPNSAWNFPTQSKGHVPKGTENVEAPTTVWGLQRNMQPAPPLSSKHSAENRGTRWISEAIMLSLIEWPTNISGLRRKDWNV